MQGVVEVTPVNENSELLKVMYIGRSPHMDRKNPYPAKKLADGRFVILFNGREVMTCPPENVQVIN